MTELYLPKEIPTHRITPTGKKLFNRGYTPYNKGKSYESVFGDSAEEIKQKISQSLKGHPCYTKKGTNGKPLVLIIDGVLSGRFESAVIASELVGISHQSISRYANGEMKPKNGWKWFYEKDYDKWTKELNNE
jgi:hypothetical protein